MEALDKAPALRKEVSRHFVTQKKRKRNVQKDIPIKRLKRNKRILKVSIPGNSRFLDCWDRRGGKEGFTHTHRHFSLVYK